MENSQHADRSASPPRRQRACLNCSKAKARCNFLDVNIGKHCDRCRRLDLECIEQRTKSLRRPRQIKPGPFTRSRVEALEQKIDGLTTLLAAGRPLSAPENVTAAASFPTPPSTSSAAQTPPQPQQTPPSQPHSQSATSETTFSPGHTLNGVPGYELSWDQVHLALTEYQQHFAPHFPFVAIEQDTDPRDLLDEKPFLFRTIMLVASHFPSSRKKAMKNSVMEYLGQQMLVQEKRDLDLLQGLLVFIAWGDLSFYLDRQITLLVNIATGYAQNLGLTRIPPLLLGRERFIDDARDAKEAMYSKDPRVLEAMEKFHTLEEQRAYLGCYYLASVNAAQFSRHSGFRSPYVEMCASFVGWQLEECRMDAALEHMVRLQLLADKIGDTFPSNRAPGSRESPGYLIQADMRLLRAELDKVAASVDQANPQWPTFWLSYHATLTTLHEPATHLSPPPPDNTTTARTTNLHLALQAAASYFHTFLSLDPAALPALPFPVFADLVAITVAASRLLLLRGVPGWDPTAARGTLDLADVLARLLVLLADAGRAEGARAGDEGGEGGEGKVGGVYARWGEKIAFIRGWFEARVRGEAGGAAAPPTAGELAWFGPGVEGFDVDQRQDNQFWLGLLGDQEWDFTAL